MSDPLSIVGLGLGVASLTAQALVGCIQTIELILKAKALKPEFQYLNIRLQLEKQRLWNWSEVSGLLDYLGGREDGLDSSLTGLNRHLILDVMLQIQTLVTEFVKVKGRYEMFFLDHIARGEDIRKGPMEKSPKTLRQPPEDDMMEASDFIKRIPGSADTMRKLLSNLEITQQLPKRLRWAIWDQGKFKGLIDRLKELNDCLLDLVDNSIKMQVFQMTKETNLNFLGLYNKIDDLCQLCMALVRDKDSGDASSLQLGLRITQGRSPWGYQEGNNNELLDLTRFKALNESIEHGTLNARMAKELDLQQPGEQMRNSELNRMEIKLLQANQDHICSSEGLRSEALYHGRRVWIEWKEYQPLDLNSTDPNPNILLRVQKLAALLCRDVKPAVFRVPHCLGYFVDAKYNSRPRPQEQQQERRATYGPNSILSAEDPEGGSCRFGFVFAKPSGVAESTVQVNLFELLNGPTKPSLTDRIALARAIVNCVRYLHSVNWLHKGLRSHNIIFFPSDTGRVDYSMPYLSGFDYARPARGEEMTEAPPANPEYDIYKHPRVHPAANREGYKKSFDIYSLGIILAEIAEWKSIDDILGIPDPKNTRTLVALRIRHRLLTETTFMEAIAAGAGSLFEGSVRCCLEGGKALGIEDGEDESKEHVGAKLGKAFYEKVVKRLEEIRC